MTNNVDTLMIISPLDQSISIEGDEWVLQKISEIIQQAITEHNANIALNACKQLVSLAKISGLALAKALYLIKNSWQLFETEETFDDIAYVHIGLHKATVDRYLAVWMMYEQRLIPQRFVDEIQARNIKDQIPIAKALSNGYEISENIWEDLASAPDFATVAQIIREDVKGNAPRKSALMISLDKRGTLWVYKDGEKKFLGSLEVDTDDKLIKKAIDRIVTNVGIMQY